MEKETKDLIEKILHEIAEDIIDRFEKNKLDNDIGLLSGKTGQALFLFYYAEYSQEYRYKEFAQKILEEVFDSINSGNYYPTYCGGLAGVGWALIHLSEHNFIDKENLDVLDEIDKFLFNAMKDFISRNYYDFLHGASGIAYYFTKRIDQNSNVNEYLKYYIERLSQYVIYDEDTGTAKMISTIFNVDNKQSEVYNLSLSHGMSSIVIILNEIARKVPESDRAKKIARGFLNYLISKKNKFDSYNYSLYPSSVPLNDILDDKSSSSRLGWCYGDLGNGFAFKSASVTYKEAAEFFNNKASEIFRNLEKRKDPVLQVINDAGICHGAAGLVCIINSLSNRYSEKVYSELENYWIDITLNFYKDKKGIQGFSKFMNNNYTYDTSLLCGTTGVALSLMKSIGKYRTNWAELLLIF